MMLPIVWRAEARVQLRGVIAYIAARNPVAAKRINGLIEDALERVSTMPYLYRPGRVADTREAVVHPNYIVVYRVTEIIDVVAVLHARQRYP